MSDDRSDDETSVLPIAALPVALRPSAMPAAPALPQPMPRAEPAGPPRPPGSPAAAAPVALPPMAMAPAVMPPRYAPYRQPLPAAVGRVVFAAVLLLMFGVAGIVTGTAGAIFANALRRVIDQALRDQGVRIEQGALINVVTGFFVVLLLLGVLHVVAASGVLSHRRWGRWLAILLSLLGVIFGAVLVWRLGQAGAGGPRGTVAGLALLLPYAISLVALLYPGVHFARHRRPG